MHGRHPGFSLRSNPAWLHNRFAVEAAHATLDTRLVQPRMDANRRVQMRPPRGALSKRLDRRRREWKACQRKHLTLYDVIPRDERPSNDLLLGQFLEYVQSKRLKLYPAQESAILELFEEKNVILNTPTGSGKTLVAAALQFKALVQGNELRISSKSRDDLQVVQRLVRAQDLDFAVQFVNYR